VNSLIFVIRLRRRDFALMPEPKLWHTPSPWSLGQTWSVETVEYARGRLVDLFGDPAQRTVLLWHGRQSDARTVIRPLAELLAGHSLGVVVPDWNSRADDGGRADLLGSVHFARERVEDPDGLVLVGWSLGGVAAAGLTIDARRLSVRVAHTVCLAGAFMRRDPISGEHLATALPGGAYRSPFTLLHGVADDVVPVAASRAFTSTLEQNRWPVELVELSTDHGAIGGATYDPAAHRYSAAGDAETLAVAADVAARIAAVFGGETAP
jgi:dienelactone hydrolase